MDHSPPPSSEPRLDPRRSADGQPRWGLGEAFLGVLLSQLVAGIIASIVVNAGGWTVDDAPLWATAVINLPLHITLATVAIWAAMRMGNGPRRDYGIDVRWADAGSGVLLGVLAQLVLVPAVTYPFLWATGTDADKVSESARELTDKATTPVGVILLVFAVGIVAPIVEEIFFRGLLFGAFKKRNNIFWRRSSASEPGADPRDARINLVVAGIVSSLVFGLVHFQPILVPALTAVAGLFTWLAYRAGRLGPAIWAHAAFNGTTLLSLLT